MRTLGLALRLERKKSLKCRHIPFYTIFTIWGNIFVFVLINWCKIYLKRLEFLYNYHQCFH